MNLLKCWHRGVKPCTKAPDLVKLLIFERVDYFFGENIYDAKMKKFFGTDETVKKRKRFLCCFKIIII